MNKEKIKQNDRVEVATLGGGCFWCIEAAFQQIRGVVNVESGYAGGITVSPTYEQVCTGNTGHVEVVQVTYNPDIICFKEILNIFFTIHDPTTLNKQGADVGTQYRSVIFYHNERQKKIAEQLIKEMDITQVWDDPIVTTIEPLNGFYKAEDYHRKYFDCHPEAGYCKIVIAPKIAKIRNKYSEKLKES